MANWDEIATGTDPFYPEDGHVHEDEKHEHPLPTEEEDNEHSHEETENPPNQEENTPEHDHSTHDHDTNEPENSNLDNLEQDEASALHASGCHLNHKSSLENSYCSFGILGSIMLLFFWMGFTRKIKSLEK